MRRCDTLQACQRFHTALRLHGFGGFGFEAVDKRLQMFDLGLLLLVSRLLLRQTLGALGLIEIIIAAVLAELLLRQFHGLGGGGVEKITVVRDDDLGARQIGQMVFQPQHGF